MIGSIAAARGWTPLAWIAAFGTALIACVGCAPRQDSAASDGLVFVRRIGDSNEIVQARLSDAAERQLTRTPEFAERWPYWSDAAGRLVFQSIPRGAGAGRSQLQLWDEQRHSGSPLHAPQDRDERWPVWSPDGAWLSYAFRGPGPFSGISAQPLDGSRTRVLAASGTDDFFFRPSYSPDGTRLIAQRRGRGGRGSSLWLLNVGGLPEPLTADPGQFDMKPWFTRHGDAIVFSRRRIDAVRRDIVQIPASGGEVRDIVADPNADEHSGRPSPTRDEVAFCSDRSATTNVYLVDLAGSKPRALTQWSARAAFAPRWSPDGERIVITARPLEAAASDISLTHVVVLDRSGAILLDVPGAMPDWMPPWP